MVCWFLTRFDSDPAMKQFLLYLDETSALGKKFIIQDLDDTHVFILAEVVQILQEKVGDLMDQNSFPITQKWSGERGHDLFHYSFKDFLIFKVQYIKKKLEGVLFVFCFVLV